MNLSTHVVDFYNNFEIMFFPHSLGMRMSKHVTAQNKLTFKVWTDTSTLHSCSSLFLCNLTEVNNTQITNLY